MSQDSLEKQLNPLQVAVENDQLMSSAQKRFYASEQCDEARKQLQALVDSDQYETNPSYHLANPLSFIERHLYYLSIRPPIELNGYISNLKLMTRIRNT